MVCARWWLRNRTLMRFTNCHGRSNWNARNQSRTDSWRWWNSEAVSIVGIRPGHGDGDVWRNDQREEAHRIGLVNHLVEPDELNSKTMEIAHNLASKSPHTIRVAKAAVRAALEHHSVQEFWQSVICSVPCLIPKTWPLESKHSSIEKKRSGQGLRYGERGSR